MERRQHILENLIYVIIWLVVIIVPVFGYTDNGSIEWNEVRQYWLTILPFFILFVLNNYLLIPCFLLRERSWLYLLFILITTYALFSALPMVMGKDKEKRAIERREFRPFDSLPPDEKSIDRMGPPPPGREQFGRFPELQRLPSDRKPPMRLPFHPSPILIDWLIALLVIGINIAIRFLFKTIRDDRQIKELERQTLQTELNYLKAQVNPHFFMNTLNNIHALIDIDTEKAKDTVIELSKIMRYVLYEAEQSRVPLTKEIQFLDNYTALMRIRYAEGVEIRTTFPDTVPDAQIPPLLLVTLLENAYKHGISYRHQSFIYTTLQVEDGRLIYLVVNSIFPDLQHPAGMGMENLRKRLNLLYGTNYTLDVIHTDNEYSATLNIPLQ